MADTVAKFANEAILPKAREMDEAEAMDPAVVEQMFEQGLMGIEIPEEYGGSGMNFTSAIIAIEELARVDPSVSVMCDVHNTLVNTAIIKWGSESLKKKWLPRLSTDTVGMFATIYMASMGRSADMYRILLPVGASLGIRRLCARYQGHTDGERLQAQWQQDVDNEQHGGRLLHCFRQP